MKKSKLVMLLLILTSIAPLSYSNIENNREIVLNETTVNTKEEAIAIIKKLDALSNKHKTTYINYLNSGKIQTPQEAVDRAIRYNELMAPIKELLLSDEQGARVIDNFETVKTEQFRETQAFLTASEEDKAAYIEAMDSIRAEYYQVPTITRENDTNKTIETKTNTAKQIKQDIITKYNEGKNTNTGGTTSNTTDTSTTTPVVTDPKILEAQRQIDALDSLNEAHKKYYKDQLTSDNTETILAKATKVNTLMKPIKEAVDNFEKFKTTEGYVNSSESEKTNYNQNIEKAKEYVNASEDFEKYENPMVNPLEVLNKSLTRTKNAIAKHGSVEIDSSQPTNPSTTEPNSGSGTSTGTETGTGNGSSTGTGTGTGNGSSTGTGSGNTNSGDNTTNTGASEEDIAKIDALSNLSEQHKTYYKNLLTSDATNNATVIRKANSMNKDVATLKQYLDNEEQFKNSPEYIKAKADVPTGKNLVDEYEQILSSLKTIYYSNDPNPFLEKVGFFTKISSETRKMKTAHDTILEKYKSTDTGETNTGQPAVDIDKRKREIKDELNSSPLKFIFTDLQRAQLEQSVDSKTTSETLEEEYTRIKNLSNTMKELRKEARLHKELETKPVDDDARDKFLNLSTELREKYDKLVKKSFDATNVDTETPIVLTTETEINALIKELTDFRTEFNNYVYDKEKSEEVINEVNKLENLNELQKNEYKNQLSTSSDDTKQSIIDKFTSLDKLMKEAKTLLGEDDKELLENSKISLENKEKYKASKEKLKNSTLINTSYDILNANILEFKTIREEIKPFDFTNYEKLVSKFSNYDTSIVDRLNEKIFLDVKFVNNVTDIYKAFASLKTGLNLKVTEVLNTKVGVFAEYDKKDTHNISIGTNISTDYFTSYIKYRVAILDKLIQHNVDGYLGLKYKINAMDNLKITTGASLFINYTPELKLDEKVKMKDKIVYLVDAGLKLDYKLNTLNFSLSPKIKYLYDVTNLENNFKEVKTTDNSSFLYDTKFEVTNTFSNGIEFGTYIDVNGKITKKPYANIGVGLLLNYNW